MISNFSIFKGEKDKENSPDYRISAKIDDNYEEIGACWLKEGKNGKYFSCQLRKQYKDKPGYVVIPDRLEKAEIESGGSQIPF